MSNSIISKVYLLDTPLKNDYKDTFYFDSKSAQQTYFQGKTKHTFNNVSYLRKDNVIKLNVHYDSICTCNYLMYQNTGYSDKWIYCFITEMKYISDGVTEVHIETDVIQTWMFDYVVNKSFVEREHVSDDTIGLHTIPEGLETGDYIVKQMTTGDVSNATDDYVVIASTVEPSELEEDFGGIYQGVYSGFKYYAYPKNSADALKSITTMIQQVIDKHGMEAINCVFIAPHWLIGNTGGGVVTQSFYASGKQMNVNPITSLGLDNYTPRNKKLLTYPYIYHLATNGGGNSAIYKQELFKGRSSDGDLMFDIGGALTPGCSIRMTPKQYGGHYTNIEEGLNLGKYPQCNWGGDLYTNWMVQNGVNVGATILGGIGSAIAGGAMIATGAGALVGAGMVAGGLGAVFSSCAQINNADLMPPQTSGNTNNGDIMYSSGNLRFDVYGMTIKEEYAKVIDEYFDKYGYKVNRTKTPNKNHRSQWWYTKLIDANITGAVPGNDLKKIIDCYNQGITFWKNPSNIYNYSLSNSII